jgi:hypothetical protein
MNWRALIVCLFAIGLVACAGNSPDAIATGVAATQQFSQLSTQAALGQVTATPTLDPEITLEPTSTPQPVPTATPEFNWDGVWDLSIPGSTISQIPVDHIGWLISSQLYTFSGNGFLFQGILNERQNEVAGSIFTIDPATGGSVVYDFSLQMVAENHDQFRGSYIIVGATFEWCGARNGASFPTPCQWP